MPPMDIASLEAQELIDLSDNRMKTIKGIIQAGYNKLKIQDAIDQLKEIMLEFEDRLSTA